MNKSFNERLIQVGVDELRFFIPLKSALHFDNAETWQECYISEHKYRLKDNYKMTLVPINQRYPSRDFYISDFESVLESGHIIQKTNINQYMKEIIWYEVYNGIPLINKASVLVGA